MPFRSVGILLVAMIALLAATALRAEHQTFTGDILPGQERAFTFTTDAPGPINYTLFWDNGARLRSAIYAPGAGEPDATSEHPSPQAVANLTSATGQFTIRVSQPKDDPAGATEFTLEVNYPMSTTFPSVGDDARDDPERPPNKWVFTPDDTPSPMFEVGGGNRAFLEYSLDGGVTYTAIPATYVINRGPNDLVTATIPAQDWDTAVAYRMRADAPYGGVARRNKVLYFVSEAPTALDDLPDDPPFYKGEGKATPSPDAWRDQSVYMIVTDRFFNGDPTNDRLGFSNFNRAIGGRMHGGDWAGLTAQLDYLLEIGVTALWVSPPLQNWEAYHGYAAVNFFLPARQHGTLQEFRDFVDAAHARGMYVIMDVVCNHQADLIYNIGGDTRFRWPDGYQTEFSHFGRLTSNKPLPYPKEFRALSLFHNYGHIDRFDDQGAVPSHAELGEFPPGGLDDFRTETPYLRYALAKIFKWWIANTDVDGFRLDAVKHVELGFWQTFLPEIRAYARGIGKNNFFTFGEFFDGRDDRVGRYTGTRAGGPPAFDGMLYFPMHFTLLEVFKGTAPTSRLDTRYSGNHYYQSPDLLLNFLDNHDIDRFLNGLGANGPNKLRVALGFLYTSRGIPTLYYGTEQGFDGPRRRAAPGGDDCNREDMFANPDWVCNERHPGDSFDTSHPLFQYIQRLNRIRAENIALRRGDQTQRWNSTTGPGLYVYTRRYGNQEILVALNTSGTRQTATPRVSTDLHPPGTLLADQLSALTLRTYDAGGGATRVNLDLPPYGAQIFKR